MYLGTRNRMYNGGIALRSGVWRYLVAIGYCV